MDLTEGALSLDSVIARLQKHAARPAIVNALAEWFDMFVDGTSGKVFEHNERLDELMRICAPALPLVDARSKSVFMLRGADQESLQCVLSDIYFPDPEGIFNPPRVRRSRWLKNGYGWYVSLLSHHTIVVHENYRLRDFETSVFERHQVLKTRK